MNNKKIYGDMIFHFTEIDGFLYTLHEDLYFDVVKFNDLLQKIKLYQKSDGFIDKRLNKTFFEGITYMYDLFRDLHVHPNKINISTENFYINILELKNLILELYNIQLLEKK